jgi:hypothetical protein
MTRKQHTQVREVTVSCKQETLVREVLARIVPEGGFTVSTETDSAGGPHCVRVDFGFGQPDPKNYVAVRCFARRAFAEHFINMGGISEGEPRDLLPDLSKLEAHTKALHDAIRFAAYFNSEIKRYP